jgi:hypothetical protein
MNICLTFAIAVASSDTLKKFAQLEPEEKELDNLDPSCVQLFIQETPAKEKVEAQVT